MPELPEVETTVLSLKEEVLERTFVRVWAERSPSRVKEATGKCVKDIKRRGKCIVFVFQDGYAMFAHLRMTGHFLIGKWSIINGEWRSKEQIMQDKRNGYLRFIFFLNDGRQLALSDQRKFADIYTAPLKDIDSYLQALGPDILSLEKEKFINMIRSKKREIKPLLMDQRFVTGIGNIYAAEALFMSGIYPGKRAHLLSEKEAEKIYFHSCAVLNKSISLKGDSTSDYRLLNGEKGGYQNEHLVYNRKNQPCFSCGEKIKRIILGGRGTYYCLKCQKI